MTCRISLDVYGHVRARTRKARRSNMTRVGLQHPERFSLEPALKLGPGPFHTPADSPMFGAIGDSAPDRWGRALMRRMERRRAEREDQTPRTLQEIDYLLLVDDETRQGALRFAETEGGPFLREEGAKRMPPLLELPRAAVRRGTRCRRQGHRRRSAVCFLRPVPRWAARGQKRPCAIKTVISQSPNSRIATTTTTRLSGRPSR